MSIEEQSRERMAKQRQEEEHLQETMRTRSEKEGDTHDPGRAHTEEETREMMAKHQDREEQRRKSMLHRAEEEAGMPKGSAQDQP